MQQKIVIIGNGISGITCARHIRKRDSESRIIVISDETDHFFSRTALMYIYMGHMKYAHTKPYEDWFWKKNRIELLRDKVENVEADQKSLALSNHERLAFDKLVIAVGSSPNKFGWPGQDLKGVQGLYSYQDLESMEIYTDKINHAVVVGGGLIGIEMTEMLHSRNIPVTFLVRESSFWNQVLPPEESDMVNQHIREHGIDLRLETELSEIRGDDSGRVKEVVTKNEEKIACQFAGLTVGVHPNIGFLKDSKIETDKGVIVNEYFETNIPDIYAIGDCAQFENPPGPFRKKVEQVWYTGRIHGETLALTLTQERTPYVPGNWFNSAKFFDIEYQTYGEIYADEPEDISSLFWKDAKGKQSIRIQYEKSSKKVKGFNLMGIRYRHEVCDRWLNEESSLRDVVANLQIANFDPEFFSQHENEVKKLFNQQYPSESVDIRKKRKGLAGIFNF